MMRQLNLKAEGKPKYKKTTKSNHREAISPNLVNQDFNVDAPNRLHVSDITYIPTREGWLYLMVVLDCFGRKIKTWSLRDTLSKEIVTEPVARLLKNEKPTQLIFHSDRGSQYASKALRQILQTFNVKQSMSGKGNCYDNAVAESFFKTLKYELSKKIFKTRKEAEIEIFEYIEMYYNSKRLHSSNNYRTPNQVYEEFKVA
jgi:putative transposase